MDQNQKEVKAPVPAQDQVSDGLEIGSSSDVVSKSLEKAYGKLWQLKIKLLALS